MVYRFIASCYRLGKITAEDVNALATKKIITKEQAETILNERKGL